MTEKLLSREEFESLREKRDNQPYTPDWQVYRVTDRGEGEKFRFRTEGFNLNCEADKPGYRFIWDVPSLNWRYFWGNHYWSVIIPWSDNPTPWHPTDKEGPFSTLSRGAFKTEQEANTWAEANLGGEQYYLKAYTLE